MTHPARVGIVGFMHEVNALAAPVTLAHGLQVADTPGGLAATWEARPAIERLRALRDVEIVDLPVWEFGASGPLLGDDFRAVLAGVDSAFRAAGRLDAVIVLGHGAGRTSDDLDPDATFLRLVRRRVGAAPVVVVLDFHADLSPAMCDLADVVVGYRTNPHVDIEERVAEAAEHVHRLLDAPGTVRARCRLPMVLPQIAQLTSPDEPLGEVLAAAVARCVPPVRNVSVFGGFSLGDSPDAGVSVCVTVDDCVGDAGTGDASPAAVATQVAVDVARLAWSLRPCYRLHTTSVADAVRAAQRAAAGDTAPVILADTADNPGGGAPGNTTFLLAALHDASVDGVVMGLQCDPAVVQQAWAAGEGAQVRVEFNCGSTDPLAVPFMADATVLCLADGVIEPTRGVYNGSRRYPGRACALQVGGIRIGVSQHKVQCADDDTLRHVGLDPACAKVVVVKSRGHFRAGFEHLFGADQIIEVGAPGVATADLASVEWAHVPRPAFPFDEIAHWMPVVELHRQGGR